MGIKRFYKRTRNLFQRLFSRSIDVWPFASIIAFILSPALSSYVAGLALQTYTRGVVPQHEIAVTMKLIAVNVTSKKGDVISDLIESEFVIYDNGKKMDIAAFENYVDVSRTNNECDMPARIGEAGLRKRFMLTQKYLFFFDFAFNNLQGIKKAKEAAAYFINASDQVPAEYSVISFYPLRGLVINEYATKDRSRTLRTIQTLDPGEVVGGAEEIEEEYVRLLTRAERANVAEHMRDSLERSASKRMVSDYLRAVTDLAKAVRYMPGDKNLFLLSSGIPSSIIYGLGAVSGDIGDSVLRRLGEEMAKELSSANCRVFAFNTTQMGTDLFRGDAERLEHGEADVIKPPAVADSARDRRISGESILRGVSQVTGGIYFGNITGYPKSMELIYELTRSYYVLGYRVDEKWDGRYHSLRIEVKRRGCKVRAQTGYFSSKRFADYTNLERKLHLIDLALSPDISAQPAGAFPIRILSYDVGRKPYLFALSSIPETTIYRFRDRKSVV